MKKQDFDFIKNYLEKDFLLRDFVYIKAYRQGVKNEIYKVRIFYNDKIITICDNLGFAYLIGWWCEGSITGSCAENFNKLCRTYNDRF